MHGIQGVYSMMVATGADIDEAAVGVVRRLEHSQKEIVLQSVYGPVFILQITIGHVVQ